MKRIRKLKPASQLTARQNKASTSDWKRSFHLFRLTFDFTAIASLLQVSIYSMYSITIL